MAKKKIFISYDYDNDKHYKNLLVAWDKNDLFDFSFYDASVDVSVNSEDADYIKRVIKDRINSASHFLCIIGKQAYKSGWIAWEINTASNLNKKIIAVKTDQSNTSPNEILDIGASWAKSFTFESIKNAIEGA
ncbi:TIR-like domain-containing protein [Candidatus Atribacteria bacterium HGW-Atribacteria-1]|nr:MAG: TIR-like domain-containing protein [Candidatus Atribacteria bacterium HGW-Atribacteria-1]